MIRWGIKMDKKIIPKTNNYELIINDDEVKNIIKNTPKENLKTTIDSITRQYLRSKFTDKIIEGRLVQPPLSQLPLLDVILKISQYLEVLILIILSQTFLPFEIRKQEQMVGK
jgi:hypothetical protein